MPELVQEMLGSALPLRYSNCPAWRSVQAVSQHLQSTQRLAWVSLAFCVTLLARAGLTAQIWQSEPRPRRRAAPQRVLEPSTKFNLNLLQKFTFKFTGKLIPIISSLGTCYHNFEVEVWKMQRLQIWNLPLHVHWQPDALPRHVPVIWSRTGCKPDLELSSRRYCNFFALQSDGDALCGPSNGVRR